LQMELAAMPWNAVKDRYLRGFTCTCCACESVRPG